MTRTLNHALLGVLIGTLSLLSGCGGGTQSPDSIVPDVGMAYVKRPLIANRQPDARNPLAFTRDAGGDLYFRDYASPSAQERNITAQVTAGLGDVKDVEVSYDGGKLLFALHEPEIADADPADQTKWNIWEYDITNQTLRRLITSDIIAKEGDDVAPHYLADGRIIFSSTRQRQSRAVLLDEGKPQFAALNESRQDGAFGLVLHVMNSDGSDIHQISFNQSNDLDPTLLSDGRVLFTRWDHMGGSNAMSLYTLRPDGTDLQVLYGAHSHATGSTGDTVQFLQPRLYPDGRLLTITRPFTDTDQGGDLSLIDTTDYIDNDQPTWTNRNVLTGPAQTAATVNAVQTAAGPSLGGRFSAADPLWDGSDRMLVSWSACRLIVNNTIVPCTPQRLAAANVQEAPPVYGIFIYNRAGNTQLPVIPPQEGVIYTDVVAAQSHPRPTLLYDKTAGNGLDASLIDENVGVLNIRSVYDFGTGTFNGCFLVDDCTSAANITSLADLADPAKATAAQRPARFLRIVKAVGIPDNTALDFKNTAFGASSQQLMREILGYAPIEPDGSVKIKVPADVAFELEVLDSTGMRIGARHENWLQLRAGETQTCNGCHQHNTGNATPPAHGRADAVATSINVGAPTTGEPFPNTDPALFADMGATMAETRTRLAVDALLPRVDIRFDDVWTDTDARAKDASFSYNYSDLTTPAPTTSNCQTQWNSLCRIVIHYPQHIHPLWSATRAVLDGNGVEIANHTCTNCHNSVDANAVAHIPDAQLDLSDGPSADLADHLKSYRELLFSDNEQETVLINGVLVLQDKLIPALDVNGNPLFQVDANGNPVLDSNNQPIPILVTVPGPPPAMSVAGARASNRFFAEFATGGTHEGWLLPAELRLIAEWLDIGAQYYNDPFAAPLN